MASSLTLSLDVVKALDSLEFPFLLMVLQCMGFGDNFLQALYVLSTAPTVTLKINDTYSDDISINRGARQGCPLSPGVFVLAQAIRATASIHGIIIGSFKLTLFCRCHVIFFNWSRLFTSCSTVTPDWIHWSFWPQTQSTQDHSFPCQSDTIWNMRFMTHLSVQLGNEICEISQHGHPILFWKYALTQPW